MIGGAKGKRQGTLEDVIAVAMKGLFKVDETIKPVVSYLAANLHERALSSIMVSLRSSKLIYYHWTFIRQQAPQLSLLLSLLFLVSPKIIRAKRPNVSSSFSFLFSPIHLPITTPSPPPCLSPASAFSFWATVLPPSSPSRSSP